MNGDAAKRKFKVDWNSHRKSEKSALDGRTLITKCNNQYGWLISNDLVPFLWRWVTFMAISLRQKMLLESVQAESKWL